MVTNFDQLKTIVDSKDYYRIANILMNISLYSCEICPRSSSNEDRCNEDCNNGFCEWLAKKYEPKCIAWENC